MKIKTKLKEILPLFLAIILVSCVFSGCGSNTEADIIGKWYNSDGKCLDIRSDCTWKLEDSYGTGTWKLLEDKITFEFTDYYGDTQESIANESELGKYIDFGHYGDFYLNAYPTIDALNQDDIFEGIKLNVSGASPCCTISVDTSSCSDFIKQNITYSIDSEYCASGETVIVSANMNSDATKENTIQKEFTVEADLRYINSEKDMDSTVLNNIIKEYLETEKKDYYSNDTSEFYAYIHDNQEIISATLSESGFISLNLDYADNEAKNRTKNAYYCIYVIQAINHNNNETYNYVAEVFLYNVCKDKKGQFTWNINGLDTEEIDKIVGMCYEHKSDFTRHSDYLAYYKSDKYKLTAMYTNENFDFASIN